MDNNKEYFIYLLSCFLNGEKPVGKIVDWQAIYRISDIHGVSAVIAREINQLETRYKPDDKLSSYFRQMLGYTIQNSEIKDNAFNKLKAILNENKIDHVFVKGIIIKNFYPVKELRTSGDIDFIVRENQFDNAVDLLKKNGIKTHNSTFETVSYEINTNLIEMHRYSDVGSNYFDDVFTLCVEHDKSTYFLDDYNHLLYVVCHMVKHLKYRGAGIRMLMDIDVLVRNIPDFNQKKFYEMCKAAGILKSAQALLSLSNYFFKTPIVPSVDFKTELKLLSDFETVLLDGGRFGYSSNSVASKYVKESVSKNGNITSLSKFKILFKMAFPSREYLKNCYPYYKKCRFLYPAAVINRLLDGAFKKRKHVKNTAKQIFSDNNASNIQLELLSELEIEN